MQSSPAPGSTNSVTTLAEGRYRLVQILGTGGMATVYRAYDTRLDVERAIKVLHASMSRKKSIRTRFDNEARTMAKLHHPNIVMVHDVASDGDIAFMVMEMLEGGSVMGWIERHGPMPPRQAVEVTIAMLAGLELAHARGIVHRDIKPHNVLLAADGTPKLTDFGIAQLRDGERSMTATSAVMGTWAYMAPEQKQSAKGVDARSDLYAVACSLYAMITGEEPFDLFSTEVHEEVKVRLPLPIAEIVRKGARYKPDDRYPDAAAFIEALKRAIPELPELPADAPPLGGNVLPAPTSGSTSLTFDTDSLPGTPVPAASVVEGTLHRTNTSSRSGYTTGSSEITGVTKGQVAAAAFASVGAIAAIVAVAVVVVVGVAVALTWDGGGEVAAAPEAVPEVATPDKPEPRDTGEPVAGGIEVGKAAKAEDPPAEPPPEPPPEAAVAKASKPAAKPDKPKSSAPVATVTKLYVNSRPWSYVSIDGERQGRTGWSGDVKSGKHEIALESGVDGTVAKKTVSVTGDELRFCWDFAANAECPK